MARPLKYKTPEEMQAKINAYFKQADKQGVCSLGGLCMYLDLTYEGLAEYQRRPLFSVTIKKAKNQVERKINELAMQNKLNPTMVIFNLKNNFGWNEDSKKFHENLEENESINIKIELEDGRQQDN